MNVNGPLFMAHWGQKLLKKLAKPIKKFKEPVTQRKWNIVRGDMVEVIQGPQVGQRGKVEVVIRQKNRVIIEGVNMRRRIVKKGSDGTPGKIITRACSVHYSNVMLIDPSTK
jgi:large subunit ribosomal protein L24